MNKQTPLISVVFTSYNHKRFLKQALDSIVNQTYINFEIIIIDDCSTDGSQEILLEYKNIPNIKLVLSEKNSGSYVYATNLGATYATGEYILFAQCDDWAENNQFDKLAKILIENDSIGVVFSQSNLVDENGKIFSNDFIGRELAFKKHIKKTNEISGEQMKKFLSFSCIIPNLSAALLRRDLYEKVKGLSTNYLVVADWEFWLDLTEHTNFYYINEPLNNFRQHNATIRSKIKIKKQIFEVYAMFYNHINKFNLTSKQKKQIQIGAGAVWFAYFFENKKIWLNSFYAIYKDLNQKYNNLFWFLLKGIVKHFKEFFNRKFK